MMLARTQYEKPRSEVDDWKETALALQEELAKVTESKNRAYSERNALVATLARMYPSGLKTTDIPGWHPDWHNARDAHLFAGLPRYEKEWDGHTTEEKYERLFSLNWAGVSPTGRR
jgi:hypothetical protein